MTNFFVFLFLLSLICLIVGLVKPPVFKRFSKKEITKKQIGWIFGIAVVVSLLLIGATTEPEKKAAQPTKTEEEASDEARSEPESTSKQKYPSLTEETIDKNLLLNCLGGDEVSLWDKPTDAAGGARVRDKVPCGTLGWAFNKYYNEEHKITFYAINTNDSRVKTAYGWVTEDLISWK